MKTVEEILNMAETTLSALAVAEHQCGYTHLIVKIRNNKIVDACLYETQDGYYCNLNGGIVSISAGHPYRVIATPASKGTTKKIGQVTTMII